MREKRGGQSCSSSPKRFLEESREICSLRDDLQVSEGLLWNSRLFCNSFPLQAAKDDAAASKEVIAVLRKQVETLQKEKETL